MMNLTREFREPIDTNKPVVLKGGPWASISSISLELARKQILRPSPRTFGSEALELGPRTLLLTSPSGDSDVLSSWRTTDLEKSTSHTLQSFDFIHYGHHWRLNTAELGSPLHPEGCPEAEKMGHRHIAR